MYIGNDIDERAKMLAEYIIETKETVRSVAKKFNTSKSTVHKDLSQRLEKISPSLAEKVKEILELNKSERHIRGGLATKQKYIEKKTIKDVEELALR